MLGNVIILAKQEKLLFKKVGIGILQMISQGLFLNRIYFNNLSMGTSTPHKFITSGVQTVHPCMSAERKTWLDSQQGTRSDPKSRVASRSSSPSCEVIRQPSMEDLYFLVLQGSSNLSMVTMRKRVAWVIEIHRKSQSSFLADGFSPRTSTRFIRAADRGSRWTDLNFIPPASPHFIRGSGERRCQRWMTEHMKTGNQRLGFSIV